MPKILRAGESLPGCDVTLALDGEPGRKIRVLQLTDMQFIDATQRRTPDRLRPDEISAWMPDSFDALAGNQIKSLIAQTRPELILLTGDLVYGSFDDSGRFFERFCGFMESFGIPWAPVFGNHDNESRRGVDFQCELLESLPNCLFVRGSVSGNGNYTVGLTVGGRLVRAFHMLDSHGCLRPAGLCPDQLALVRENSRRIREFAGELPSFVAFHIPTTDFADAELAKGYPPEGFYTLGVDIPAHEGDFGAKLERQGRSIECPEFAPLLREIGADAVIVGHCHAINTVIRHDGISWIFGLKTGQYDYHTVGALGGTLYTLEREGFEVVHVPALTKLAPYPGLAPMFTGFFAQ